MYTVTVRFELEDGNNVDSFMETIGRNLDYVLSAVELKDNGVPAGPKIDFTKPPE